MAELSHEAPLAAAGSAAVPLAVGVEVAPPVGMVSLRAEFDSFEADAFLREWVGVGLPGTRRFLLDGERGAYWMAPDELLLRTAPGGAPGLVATIDKALADVHHLVLDMSDARARIRITGAGAAEVIAKGAPIDLRAGRFPPGSIRRTHIARIAIAICRMESGTETFEVLCFRSYARHMLAWLQNAAREGSLPGFL